MSRVVRTFVLVLAVAACVGCRALGDGPPDEFWRSQDHPTLAWDGPGAAEPMGSVRLLRFEEPEMQNMPRVQFGPRIAVFRWKADGTVVRYAYRGVPRGSEPGRRARWERVD